MFLATKMFLATVNQHHTTKSLKFHSPAIFLPSFFSSPVIFSIFGFGTRSAELRDLIAPAIH